MGSVVSSIKTNLYENMSRLGGSNSILQGGRAVTDSDSMGVENRSAMNDHTIRCENERGDLRDSLQTLHGKLQRKNEELRDEIAGNKKLKRHIEKLYSNITSYRRVIKEKENCLAELDNLIAKIILDTLVPYAAQNGVKHETWTDSMIMDTQVSLARDAADASVLREQVQALQKEMLSTIDKAQTSSDEQLAQEFRSIVAQVKTLTRTVEIFRDVDITAGLGHSMLQTGVAHHYWSDRARKKLYIEGWIWSVLLELVFKTPFMTYGANCRILNHTWYSLYSSNHANGWPTPTHMSESWRCTTVDTMLGLVDRKTIKISVLGFRSFVAETIERRLARISATETHEHVFSIVDKACALAVNMSRQKFRLQLTWPEVGSEYDQNMMKFLTDPDDNDTHGGKVKFVVNPGLTKWGDTHGNNFDCRYDIVPALVQLETGTEENESGISLV